MNGYLFNCCKDDQHIGIQLLCKKTAGKVLVNHCGCTFQMMILQDYWNTATAAANHDLIGIHQAVDGILFNDLYRLR